MDIGKLNGCIELLRKQLGEALVATSIVSMSDAQSIADFNSKTGAASVFIQVTEFINESLKKGYPPLGKYYLLDLENDRLLIFLPLGEYQWGIAVDSSKAKLGLLLNVVIPEIVGAFADAITH
jgi:hypothetical protein